MSLLELQRKILEERAKILQELDDEWAAKEIAEKLAGIHLELKEVNKDLQNAALRNRLTRRRLRTSPSRVNRKKTRKVRKRVNPEFARLGIPVPPTQQVGEEMVNLGNKVKKN